MQIINKILKLFKVYIIFISFVLFIIIFSTSFLYAESFKVSDVEISSPFDTKFNKNRVIDSGFEKSFLNLCYLKSNLSISLSIIIISWISFLTNSSSKYKF